MTWNQNDFGSGATLFDLARLTSFGGMRGGFPLFELYGCGWEN